VPHPFRFFLRKGWDTTILIYDNFENAPKEIVAESGAVTLAALLDALSEHPRRHAAQVLHDGRLERIDEHCIHLVRQV